MIVFVRLITKITFLTLLKNFERNTFSNLSNNLMKIKAKLILIKYMIERWIS